jgi:hypothetical protein
VLRIFLTLWVVIATFRIGIFCVLLALQAANRQSLAQLPLVLMLYPEGLLLPDPHSWTIPSAIGFSVLLSLGSLILAAMLTFVFALFNR